MPARLFAALIALAACGPLLAAGTAEAPETTAAAPAEPAAEPTTAPEAAPAHPEAPASEAPAVVETAPGAAPANTAEPSPAAQREVEGTKLLFLRLNLRIKLVEQELLSMSPDRLLEHMGVASDLLAQLRSRQLEDAEIARADSMEQYLQFLAESYVQLHTGKAPRKQKKSRQ